MKFILLMLALLLPVGMMLVQLTPKAGQIDAVSPGSDGKILVVGGIDFNPDATILSSTELFDPTINSFAPADQTASLNTQRFGATATLLSSGPNSGKVLIAGGGDGFNPLASTELYDPATNTFAPPNQTASMNTARANASATLLTTGPNEGEILVAGGDNNGTLASTELSDPMTNSFAVSEQTASMNVARDQMTTTLITTGPDAGKILIAGGNNGIALSSTELYDPVTNTFAPLNQTASMNSPRQDATATEVITGPNAGKILIAGGASNFGIVASTELYDPATTASRLRPR